MEKQEKKITRKEAIKKAGITGLAAASLLLLNTQAKASASGTVKVKGNNGFGNGPDPVPGGSGPNNGAENDIKFPIHDK